MFGKKYLMFHAIYRVMLHW